MIKKKKSSAAGNLNAYEKSRRDFGYLSDKTTRAPLDDIALRVIVSNIPKHRTTCEKNAESNTESYLSDKKPKAA